MEEIKKYSDAVHNQALKIAELAMEMDFEESPENLERYADVIVDHTDYLVAAVRQLQKLAEERREKFEAQGLDMGAEDIRVEEKEKVHA